MTVPRNGVTFEDGGRRKTFRPGDRVTVSGRQYGTVVLTDRSRFGLGVLYDEGWGGRPLTHYDAGDWCSLTLLPEGLDVVDFVTRDWEVAS